MTKPCLINASQIAGDLMSLSLLVVDEWMSKYMNIIHFLCVDYQANVYSGVSNDKRNSRLRIFFVTI